MGRKRKNWEWTKNFVQAYGYWEYVRLVHFESWLYRLMNWRCWFGHDLGETQWSYEEGFRYEGWRLCGRPRCEYCEEDMD